MKIRSILLPALLCAWGLSGACSDDESTIVVPAPETASGRIAQIRIESGTSIRLMDFLYDDAERVTQQIVTSAPNTGASDDTELTTAIIRYDYGEGRIEETPSSGPSRTLVLNDRGAVGRVESTDGTSTEFTYNANGLYYEEPSTEAWCQYEYLLSGERCNLARITAFGAENLLGSSERQRIITFEYGEQANDANLDLSYLLSRDVQSERLRLTDAALFGWCGMRDSNLPERYLIEYPSTGTLEEYTITYELDARKRVARINVLRNNTSEHTLYTMTYAE